MQTKTQDSLVRLWGAGLCTRVPSQWVVGAEFSRRAQPHLGDSGHRVCCFEAPVVDLAVVTEETGIEPKCGERTDGHTGPSARPALEHPRNPPRVTKLNADIAGDLATLSGGNVEIV